MISSSITFKCSEENAKEILNNILKIKEGFDKRTYTIETRSPEEEKEILDYLKSLESEGVEISSVLGGCSTKKPYETPSFVYRDHNYTFEDLIWICQKAIDLRTKSSSFVFSDAVYFNFILTPALLRKGFVTPVQNIVGVEILKSRYGTEDKIDVNDFVVRLKNALWPDDLRSLSFPNNIVELLGLMYEKDTADMGTEK